MASANRVFSITELRRTGAGVLVATPVSFRWDAKTHTAPITEIAPPLRVQTVREEPPGSGDVVEQVVSVAWQPFRMNGLWDDKWAGAGFAVATLDQFRKLVARASLVRIEFESISIVGLLTEFVPHYKRASHIEWEVTFSPHQFGDGEIRAGTIIRPTTRPTRDHVAAAEAAAGELRAQRDRARALALNDSLFSDTGSLLDTILTNIDAARSAADEGLQDDPARKLVALASRMRAVRDGAQAAINAFVKVRSDTKVAFDDATQTLRFDVWTRQTAADARRLAVRSHEAETDFRAQAEARPKAIYRPARGESLYFIATKFFGTPNAWRQIYQQNRLSSLFLDGTEELLIPQRAA